MEFSEYLNPELAVLVPVLYLLGAGVKRTMNADKHIPLILGAAGIALSLLWIGATVSVESFSDLMRCLFTGATQGMLAAGASVYINQIVKQAGK